MLFLWLLWMRSVGCGLTIKSLTGRSIIILSPKSYLIHVDEAHVIVDTGFFFQSDELFTSLDAQPNLNVTHIVLTHTHLDHAANARLLKEQFPEAKLVVHKNGQCVLRTGVTIIPGSQSLFVNFIINIMKRLICGRTDLCDIDKTKPDLLIHGGFGERTQLTNSTYLINTPGHSWCSMTYVVEHLDRKICFVGDIMTESFLFVDLDLLKRSQKLVNELCDEQHISHNEHAMIIMSMFKKDAGYILGVCAIPIILLGIISISCSIYICVYKKRDNKKK